MYSVPAQEPHTTNKNCCVELTLLTEKADNKNINLEADNNHAMNQFTFVRLALRAIA